MIQAERQLNDRQVLPLETGNCALGEKLGKITSKLFRGRETVSFVA